jgi:Tol biopolymer transport system component
MSLASGHKLGPYEISSPLGAGGMGEVYRARDTRLGRDVAIKVLPEALAKDGDRLQRFEHEARVLGALNHPNLLAIFDVGSADGLNYLVSELLEGKSLRERLQGGALPSRKTADYSAKIASGLAAAHEKGIVHRDLKPENVFVTNDEQVKILDFGLARYAAEAKDSGVTLMTAGPGQTAPGTVMGTVGYMSPEQVRGEAADSRSDIFSFGALLYEMASGKRAFAGETAVETMSAILKSEPAELDGEASQLAPGMARIVEHCLEKNPGDRFQSARDLGFALKALSGTGATAALKNVKGRKTWGGWKQAAGAAAIAAVGMAIGFLGNGSVAPRLLTGVSSTPVVRAVLPVPSGVTMLTLGDEGGGPEVSPDGRNLVFNGVAEGKKMLFVRPLDGATARALPGTEGGKFPFWAPDGKSVGFFADKQLKRVDIAGGPPVSLARADDARGGAWAGDTILYTPFIYEAIWQVPASGGKPSRVTTVNPSLHTTHRWPHFLADGKHFIYLAQHHLGGREETAGIYAASIDGGTPKLILRTNGMGIYSSGYLLYYREGSLMAQALDTGSLELKGEATPLGQVLRDSANWRVLASASENGVLVYQNAGEPKFPVEWIDWTGQTAGTAPISGQLQDLRLSPDGSRAVAVGFEGATGFAMVCDLRSGARTKLTVGENTWFAIWSPDGKRIAYSGQPTGEENTRVYLRQANGGGERELLLSTGSIDHPTDWTRDGRYVVVNHGHIGATQILLVPMFGDRKPVPLLPDAKYDHLDGRVSPDGKWLAYVSSEFGTNDLYVTSFPTGKGKWQITSGGMQPAAAWGADSRELYLVSKGDLVEAKLQTSGDSISVEALQPLFHSPFATTTLYTVFDIDPKNNRRFIGSVAPDTSSLPLTVMTNWTAELKEK